jgi:manganese-dependent inorganic pyrophosphatase
MGSVLITSYVNPDLDGVASAVAYSEFLNKTGNNTSVGIIGEATVEAEYLLDRFNFPHPQLIANADNFKNVILVDVSEPNPLGGKVAIEKVIEIIDHRKDHEAAKFPKAKIQIELVGAAATLIAEKFITHRIAISKESATLLYGAIISNTLNFRGDVTTERDKVAAQWLNRVVKLSKGFWEELFQAKSDMSGDKLVKTIVGDFKWIVAGGKKVGIAQIEMIGAKKLVEERGDEIVRILENIKQEMGLDFVFLNTIELKEAKNFFVTGDSGTRTVLEDILDIHFNGIVAQRPNLIMRKQIIPLLKNKLGSYD